LAASFNPMNSQSSLMFSASVLSEAPKYQMISYPSDNKAVIG